MYKRQEAPCGEITVCVIVESYGDCFVGGDLYWRAHFVKKVKRCKLADLHLLIHSCWRIYGVPPQLQRFTSRLERKALSGPKMKEANNVEKTIYSVTVQLLLVLTALHLISPEELRNCSLYLPHMLLSHIFQEPSLSPSPHTWDARAKDANSCIAITTHFAAGHGGSQI